MDRATRQQVDAFLIAKGITPPKSDLLAGQLYADHFRAEAAAKNPEVQKLIQSGGTGTVNKVIGDTDVRVENGKITHFSTGGIWKPIIAAGVVAGTAGLASAFAPAAAAPGAAGSAGAGIGETGAVTGLAGSGFGGTAAATGGGGILGTLGKYGRTASDIGELATAGAGGLAAGRRADDAANLYAAAQNNRALVDAAHFNRDLPMVRAEQTARGDLMAASIPDASHTGSGRDLQFSGGVHPSSFGPDTTKAGDELKRQALLKLMDPASDKLTPQITTPRQAGAGENALGIVGTGLSILGAYNRYRGGR